MAKSKKMNETRFAKILKELDAVGENILSRQNEKQSVMDDFDTERARYLKGRISEDTVASSSKKVNDELLRLDKGIRNDIARLSKLSANARDFGSMQAPKVFRASVKGIKLASSPASKRARNKKAKQRRTAMKGKISVSRSQLAKEKSLDRKISRKYSKVSKSQLAKEKALDRKFS